MVFPVGFNGGRALSFVSSACGGSKQMEVVWSLFETIWVK